jgi:hypothetical protein
MARMCSRCRNVHAFRRDLDHLARKLSNKRPDQLSSRQIEELNKAKHYLMDELTYECSCDMMVK